MLYRTLPCSVPAMGTATAEEGVVRATAQTDQTGMMYPQQMSPWILNTGEQPTQPYRATGLPTITKSCRGAPLPLHPHMFNKLSFVMCSLVDSLGSQRGGHYFLTSGAFGLTTARHACTNTWWPVIAHQAWVCAAATKCSHLPATLAPHLDISSGLPGMLQPKVGSTGFNLVPPSPSQLCDCWLPSASSVCEYGNGNSDF